MTWRHRQRPGRTFVGGIGSSAGPIERVMTFFGGSSLDGRPTGVRLDFNLHAAAIDRSGRFAFWYPPRPNVAPDGRWVLFTSN